MLMAFTGVSPLISIFRPKFHSLGNSIYVAGGFFQIIGRILINKQKEKQDQLLSTNCCKTNCFSKTNAFFSL